MVLEEYIAHIKADFEEYKQQTTEYDAALELEISEKAKELS